MKIAHEPNTIAKIKAICFFLGGSRESTEKEETNGGTGAASWHQVDGTLPGAASFCKAQSAGQSREADTKNRQDSLQETLCAIATHRRRDKAVSCLDTSLARSPQLSHGTGLTLGLLLGLAHRYSGASATKTHTHTHRHTHTHIQNVGL